MACEGCGSRDRHLPADGLAGRRCPGSAQRRARGIAKAGDGPVEMLRMFKLANPPPSKPVPRPSTNPRAVLVAADPALRETLSGLSTTMLIGHCAQLEPSAPQDVTSAAVYTLHFAGPAHPGVERGGPRPRTTAHRGDHSPHPRVADPPTASAPTPPPPCSSPPGTTPTGSATRPPSPRCAASVPAGILGQNHPPPAQPRG